VVHRDAGHGLAAQTVVGEIVDELWMYAG